MIVEIQSKNVLVPIELAELLASFRNGSVTIHFDFDGTIRRVETQRIEYKR